MKSTLSTICSTAVMLAAISSTALAQETSSTIRGTVTDEGGRPLGGSTVVVRNEQTGLTRTTTTGNDGQFSLRNLPVGSNYSVSVSNSGYAGERAENLVLSLGQTADLNFDLASAAQIQEILVVAPGTVTQQVALGPSATFDLRTLETAPAINRNIADVLRADPRIYVDEARGDINSIQCAGQSPRFNSLTVDGVRMNDAYGLNDSGYPTERMPFSYDAIREVAVELAPFDVEYGGFTACNINAVTKSGENQFFGGAFFDYTSDSLRGDSLEGDSIESGDFTEERYGFNIGGPIMQDRLFFFAAYEKLEGANLFERGALGSGAINEVPVTQAELDEIVQISRDIYQYDPGPVLNSLDNEDEKLLVKVDWNITDFHRLSLTYNYNDGFNWAESDDDLDEFEFSNHLYERGAELNAYIGSLFSDWTDRFSTEIRLGYSELDNRQSSLGGTEFGEIRVELDDVDVYLGGDDSRQSNDLNYDISTLALKGEYDLDGHVLNFGFERETLDVFNLFIQHTETEIRFDGIDDFRNGFADAIYYNNAPSQNPDDAAADWAYDINSAYIQDEFYVGAGWTLVAGLRYEWYTSDDAPPLNQDFLADYGFGNNNTVDGEGLLLPRLGFTYDYSDELTLRGGIGRYSGGNPNVWLSNNFQNNNVQQFGQRGRSFCYTSDFESRAVIPCPNGQRSLFDSDVIYEAVEEGAPSGPGWGIPKELFDAVTAGFGDNFEINYLDPDFELPSEWKLALGGTYLTDNDYVFNADLLYTQGEDSARVIRGDLEQTGTTAEGYPVYDSVREAAFVLTNSDEGNRSLNLSFSVAKQYLNGIDWSAGYSFSDAEDVHPMTSAVAFSNFQNRAFFDPQEDVRSISDYNIEHRFTGRFNFERALWGNNLTRISLFASANQGRPYSIAVEGNDIYNFTPFLEGNNVLLRPGSRNTQDGSWWSKVDFRIEQEVPGFTPNQKASVFLVIDNLTNLINDEWGVLREVDFPQNVEPGAREEARIGDASRYEIRFGVRYSF